MAALLDYADDHPGSRLLFVDTFSEAPALEEGDFHDLPRPFWPAFDPSQQARCWCLRPMLLPGKVPAVFCLVIGMILPRWPLQM